MSEASELHQRCGDWREVQRISQTQRTHETQGETTGRHEYHVVGTGEACQYIHRYQEHNHTVPLGFSLYNKQVESNEYNFAVICDMSQPNYIHDRIFVAVAIIIKECCTGLSPLYPSSNFTPCRTKS